jgi:hypothetical protein
MIGILIYILILLIFLGLLYWIIGMIPLPTPVRQIATVVIVIIFVIAMIYLLLPLAGNTGHHLGNY